MIVAPHPKHYLYHFIIQFENRRIPPRQSLPRLPNHAGELYELLHRYAVHADKTTTNKQQTTDNTQVIEEPL